MAAGLSVYRDKGLIRAETAKWQVFMFLFFSNKLGCLGSIVFSCVAMVIVLMILGIVRL